MIDKVFPLNVYVNNLLTQKAIRNCFSFVYLKLMREAENKPLQQHNVSGWVAVTERLPKIDVPVLLYFVKENIVTYGELASYGEFRYCLALGTYDATGYANTKKVTHWMALPEPPYH